MSEAKAAFAARLNQAFDQLGIPAKQHGRFTALARLFGVSAVAARDWCEGKSYPSVDKLMAIMDTVHCGADWLLFGRAAASTGDPAAVADPGVGAVPGIAEPTASKRGRPTTGGDAAGPACDPADWMVIVGDAMAPTLEAGDRIGWNAAQAADLGDGLFVLQTGSGAGAGQPLVRRLARRLDGSCELSCDNPRHAERVLCHATADGRLAAIDPAGPALRVLGRVLAFQRTFR